MTVLITYTSRTSAGSSVYPCVTSVEVAKALFEDESRHAERGCPRIIERKEEGHETVQDDAVN